MTSKNPAFNLLNSQALFPYQGPLLPGITPALSQVAQATSCLDLSLVTPVYSSALSSFLTKRNSPLTIPMFLSLFSRHPVSVGAGPPLGAPAQPSPPSQPCHSLPRCSVRACSPLWFSM